MPITKPQLPPKAGYVEVEVEGERRYKNISTGYLLGEEPEAGSTPENIILDTLADHEYRLCLTELGIN